MKYYQKYKYETQTKCYKELVKDNNYLDEPLLLGAAEVTKHWELLKNAPLEPYIERFRHDDFKRFNKLEWNVFAIGAVEQMQKIAANSPSDANTIIYCDFVHQDKIVLLEVDKAFAYEVLAQKLPAHILRNYRVHTQNSFNKRFKTINETFLHLPLSQYIRTRDLIRHLVIEL